MRGKRGFTLIELLVVISIIGLLASVVLISLNSARVKARDVKRKADFAQLSKALQLFYDKYNRMPANNQCYSGSTPILCLNAGDRGACDSNGSNAYETSMQELVTAGFIGMVPKGPNKGDYCYYNYGSGNSYGAMLVTYLETITPTTVPPDNSCRPFDQNWCSYTIASTAYCLCNTQ